MTFKRFPQYFAFFGNLQDLVKQKYPNEYEPFRFYNMDLAFKLRYLELICLRYENDKEKWEQTGKRIDRFIENVKSESLSQNELQQESSILGEQSLQYSELLMLDIDSFLVFANILLDRIPFLLRPLYKGKVTKCDIAKEHFEKFNKHIFWFQNNCQAILDLAFCKKMVSYGTWFSENLRELRNKIIVHPKWDTFRSEIDFNGKLCHVNFPTLHS
jgi:translation elongation factor EF-1beta